MYVQAAGEKSSNATCTPKCSLTYPEIDFIIDLDGGILREEVGAE